MKLSDIIAAQKAAKGTSNETVNSDQSAAAEVPASADKPKLSFLAKAAAISDATRAATVAESAPTESVPEINSLEALANSSAGEVSVGHRESVVDIPPLHLEEIDATAPLRELPEDLSKEQTDFVKMLDGLYSVVFDADLLAQMSASIMIELQQNPNMISLLADKDVRTMVCAARNSMGLARVKKAEKKTKTSSPRVSAGKRAAEKLGALSILDSMGFDDL